MLRNIMNKKIKAIIIVLFIINMSGCNPNKILLEEKPIDKEIAIETSKEEIIAETTDTDSIEEPIYIFHKKIEIEIKDLKQQINIVEFKPNDKIKIMPVFSYDHIFGFEILSEMVKDFKPYAAINGGFYSIYGRPYGMVAINGKFISEGTGQAPLFVFNEGEYKMEERKISFWFEVNEKKVNINKLNSIGNIGDTVLYTQEFGSNTRTSLRNITIRVEDGTVREIIKSEKENNIPEKGFMISFYTEDINLYDTYKAMVGEKITICNDSGYVDDFQVYECGSWLVENGENVAPNYDGYVGSLLNRDPRTAIGIKKDGNIVFVTADGRQPNTAEGFTAKEFAAFLKGYGVMYAAMLDGGSSTEMIVNEIIVNSLSFKGRERPLAGGIIIKTE